MLSAPRLPLLLLTGGAVAALATALLAQFVGGLPPCELCLWQRWAYVGAILLLLPGFASADRPGLRAGILALGGLGFVGVAAVSLFHVGVEQQWWQGLDSCSFTGSLPANVDDILAQIEAAPVVRCDDVLWSLFGLSMAGWNILYALALAVLAFAAAKATTKRARS